MTRRAPASPAPACGLAARVATWWGLGGVGLVLAVSVVRLGARAWLTLRQGLNPAQWIACACVIGTLGYVEGYRALTRRFIPCVLARVRVLAARPRGSHVVLAPCHAMLLVGAEARDLARAWLGVAAIAAAAFGVSRLPAPWRGIVDGGVAVALGLGLLALGAGIARSRRARRVRSRREVDLALPQPATVGHVGAGCVER